MNKGYPLEHEVEQIFLNLAGQRRTNGILTRTFRVPQSGSIRGLKGDVVTNIPFLKKQFLIECKARKSEPFYLDPEWLLKIEQEAKETDKIPLLVFSFKGAKKDRLWCCIRFTDYENLFNERPIITSKLSLSRKKYSLVRKKLKEYSFCPEGFLVIKLSTLVQKLEQLNRP